MNPTWTIWNDRPAEKWEEALPVGNGRLGTMVCGTPFTEMFFLNEDSVWYGGPQDRNNRSAPTYLPEIRRLIFAGRIREVQQLCSLALPGTPDEMRHYEPLGNLFLHFDGPREEISGYRHALDLGSSAVETTFRRGDVGFRRQTIASFPDGVLAIRLTADQPGSISFHAQLGRADARWRLGPWQESNWPHPDYNKYVDRNEAVSRDTAVMTARCGGRDAVELCCAVRMVAEGGTVDAIGSSVMVRGADSATVLLAADTTFREENPEASSLARLERAAAKSWETLLRRHTEDYRALYDRVSLTLTVGRPCTVDGNGLS